MRGSSIAPPRPTRWLAPALAVAAWAAVAVSSAAATTVAEITQPRKSEVRVVGFELSKGAEVSVEAVGLQPHRRSDFTAYAWILDSGTRRPVWEMDEADAKRVDGDRFQRRVVGTVPLSPGRYELYYFAGDYTWSGRSGSGDWNLMDGIARALHDDKDDDEIGNYRVQRHLDGCFARVSSEDLSAGDFTHFEPTGELPGALFSWTRMGDSQRAEKGLRLDKPMSLRVYALLEHGRRDRHPADAAYILDARTRKRVWESDLWNTRRAGGAQKNRRCDEEVALPRGEYLLCYGTDDSHSYPKFNANPPHDPLNWGVTLLPGKGFEAGAFHAFDPVTPDVAVQFTRMGDSESAEQAFRLQRDADLRILAVGEYSDGADEFADYGWIVDAATGKAVWEMTERNTAHAGGAQKNRMFDGIVHLPAGEYIAYYVTDDSHSYDEWNSAAPIQGEDWGLTIFAPQGAPATALQKIESRDLKSAADVVVEMVRVRDDERRREPFRIDKPTRVRVYALGEGRDGEMFDYGWIEDDQSGEVVWEMDYDRTRPAGGAQKNRLIDETVTLPPGSYVAHYVSDDSHSFGDWNADRPRDPNHWGLTLKVATK